MIILVNSTQKKQRQVIELEAPLTWKFTHNFVKFFYAFAGVCLLGILLITLLIILKALLVKEGIVTLQ